MALVPGWVVWIGWPLLAGLVIFGEMRRQRGAWHLLGVLLVSTYGLWIASVAFFPLPLGSGVRSWNWWSFNAVPFRSLVDSFHHASTHTLVRLHGGNSLLLVPFTLLGPMLWPGLRRWWRALLLGLGLSLAIELTQLALGLAIGSFYRSVDVDDVILNTAGAMLGYGLYAVGRATLRRIRVSCAG